MTTRFFVLGLPASFTSDQLRQLLDAEADDLKKAEMLPDTIATGTAYIQMANSEACLRAAGKVLSKTVQHSLGVKPLICQDHTAAFQALSKRWEAERVYVS